MASTTSSVDGLISGLNTTDIITKLMQIERQPQVRLTQKIDDAAIKTRAYQTLNSRLLAVKDAAKDLAGATGWQAVKASTTNADVATVSTSSSALPGALSFVVDRLATSQVLVSSGSVSGITAPVIAAGTKLLGGDVSALGLSGLTAAGAAVGQHTIAVTQSSAGAAQTGTALSGAITIAPGSTLGVALDGTTAQTNSIALVAGTYTPAQLATMITSASGGLLNAKVNGSGALELSTRGEGSAAHLAVTAAAPSLGFAGPTAVATGVDGKISMDGTITTVTDVAAGSTVTINGVSGAAFRATATSGLRVASASVSYSDVGDGSLGSYVTALNAANLGLQAAAVQVAPGQFRLQLQSTVTGVRGSITLDTAPLAAALGSFQTVRAAGDAQLTVGSGPSAYTITSDKNAIEVTAGVTVNLLKADPTTVTINTVRDTNTVAGKVGLLVDAINSALKFVSDNNKYDSKARSGGIFLGDSTARDLADALYRAVAAVPGSVGATLATAGVSLTKEGTVALDRSVFLDAYAANPTGVAAVFQDLAANPTGTQGAAGRLLQVATRATDSVDGSITAAIKGRKTETDTWTAQVEQMEVRLSARETNLRRQYNTMETTLGNLRNQSNWLSGQISSLSK